MKVPSFRLLMLLMAAVPAAFPVASLTPLGDLQSRHTPRNSV